MVTPGPIEMRVGTLLDYAALRGFRVRSVLATTAPLWIGDCKFLTINDCLRAPIGSDPRPRLRFLHPSLLQCASLSGLHQNGQPLTRFPFYTFSSPRMVQKSSARLSSEM